MSSKLHKKIVDLRGFINALNKEILSHDAHDKYMLALVVKLQKSVDKLESLLDEKN